MNAQQDFLAVAQDRPRTGPFPICRQYAHMEGRSPDASAFLIPDQTRATICLIRRRFCPMVAAAVL
jgi:hypothetical protein